MQHHKLYTSHPIVNPHTDAFISDNSVFLNQLALPATPPPSPQSRLPVVSPRKLGETRETPGDRTLHEGFLRVSRAVLSSSDLPPLRTVPPPSPTQRILNLPIREDARPQHNHTLIDSHHRSPPARSFLESCSVRVPATSSHKYTHRAHSHLCATPHSTASPSPTPGHHDGLVSGILPSPSHSSTRARSSHTTRSRTTTLPHLAPVQIPQTPTTSIPNGMSTDAAKRLTPCEGLMRCDWNCLGSGAKCSGAVCSPLHNITIHLDSRYVSALRGVAASPRGLTNVQDIEKFNSTPHPPIDIQTASHSDIRKDPKDGRPMGYFRGARGIERHVTCVDVDAVTAAGEREISSDMLASTHDVIKPTSLASIGGVGSESYVNTRPVSVPNFSSGRLLAFSRSLKGERLQSSKILRHPDNK